MHIVPKPVKLELRGFCYKVALRHLSYPHIKFEDKI